jgi:uncharacterized protein YbjT (DUF2867 family)
MSKNLLVIFGATGNQGGSIAHTVLDSPSLSQKYTVRAITRSASNPKAQALASKGAEIVEADLDKPETLKAALEDAHTIFVTTNTTYDGHTREVETRQAKALCSEALAQNAQFIIWSSMSHPAKITNGVITGVSHFDDKAEIEQYIRSLPIRSAHFAPAAFMQNFLTFSKPQPSPSNDGTYVLGNICPSESLVPLIDITETGKWVAAILADPDTYSGSFFSAAEGLYTWSEIAQIMSKVSGKTVRHVKVPDEVFKGFFPEGWTREAYFDMFRFIGEWGYYGEGMKGDVEWTREQVRGEITGLEGFLRREGFELE